MGQGSKRRVLNQTETLKRRNDEGSLILDTSGGFLNDDSEREEGSKASVNSPFCSISLTIASELEGSLPLLPLLGKLGGVGLQLQWKLNKVVIHPMFNHKALRMVSLSSS